MLQLNTAPGIPGVLYRGLKDSNTRRFDIQAGEAQIFAVREGDLLSVHNVDGGSPLNIAGIADAARQPDEALLSLDSKNSSAIDWSGFDCRRLRQLIKERGGDPALAKAVTIFDAATQPGELFTCQIATDGYFVAFARLERDYLETGGGGRFRVDHQPSFGSASQGALPDPFGKVREEFRISRATAHAYEVKKGQFVQIIDVEGQQCSDFMAMRSEALDQGLERYIDSTVSRTVAQGAYPLPGLHDKFFDQDIRPLLSVRQDTVGRHDTFALACTARGYEERGFPGHINCSDNISGVFEPYGIKRRAAWPAINFFFNSWIDTGNNQLSSDEAWSRAGDYVVMEALTDLVCVSTACPDDVDPINGWNPTDIHVRIYDPDTSIQHAVSYRNQPDEAARMTRHSPFHSKTSKLTSNYQVAQDVWLPANYDGTRSIAEYWRCRENATLQDMSSLRKFDIMGPDAEELLQHCMTRNVAKLSEHRGLYALMCDERGAVIDDGTLFRLEPRVFRWCCGSDNSALHLREQADKLGLRVWIKSLTERLVNLALQGPKSRDILQNVIFTQPYRPALENLKWFGFTHARLHDRDGPLFMLTRTGFTGELGYEIFCDASDAETIWDGLMTTGEAFGLGPMGGEALAMLRIEAGLMISGAEFEPNADALEAGLGFAVDFKKPEFLGRAALERNASAVRKKLVGLNFNSNDAPAHGDPVFVGREQVGVVTSATVSPSLGHAIAMARIAVENCETGSALEVGTLDGHMKRLPCTVTTIPFLDPKREKPRA